MSNVIRAELSSESHCTALGITVRSPAPVLALCRQLVESSTYGSSTPLDAYAFNIRDVFDVALPR